MKFNEKIKELRKNANFTQTEMAEKIDVSLRTYKNYELGESYPRNRKVYYRLADALGVDVNYLLTEDEEFVTSASEKYGLGGRKQAEKVIHDVAGLFAGGELSDVDKDAVMQALQQVYWDSKEENKKYTPKKYLKGDSK
ncbi:MAG: helix-turn-helix transcriptional regulator [Proteocatella sp.]